MKTFHAEVVLQENGHLQLDQLPFSKGQTVHVLVSPAATSAADVSLKGTVLKYESPLDPIAEEDWEAGK